MSFLDNLVFYVCFMVSLFLCTVFISTGRDEWTSEENEGYRKNVLGLFFTVALHTLWSMLFFSPFLIFFPERFVPEYGNFFHYVASRPYSFLFFLGTIVLYGGLVIYVLNNNERQRVNVAELVKEFEELLGAEGSDASVEEEREKSSASAGAPSNKEQDIPRGRSYGHR